ncbi:MAG TPA: hypothetical protein VKY31_09220, partial [Terriglobia bacterium]|nr:hypothetical protein [Terriglobia bacterium]
MKRSYAAILASLLMFAACSKAPSTTSADSIARPDTVPSVAPAPADVVEKPKPAAEPEPQPKAAIV